MFDGIGACDHTYAADSVKGYAVATDYTDKEGAPAHNSGIGYGHLASEATKVHEKVVGYLTLHMTKLCCFGDTVVRHVDVLKVVCESDRKVESITDDTVLLLSNR